MLIRIRQFLIDPVRRLNDRFRHDDRGISAVEFALILPLLITFYLGVNEVTQAITIKRKLSHATSALGDMVAQAESVSSTELDNIMDATAAILMPYPTDNLRIVLSGVEIDGNGVAKVSWSKGRNRGALATGSKVSLPAGVGEKNTGIVMAELDYDYTPQIGYVITGTITLEDQFYLRPRIGDRVTYKQ